MQGNPEVADEDDDGESIKIQIAKILKIRLKVYNVQKGTPRRKKKEI